MGLFRRTPPPPRGSTPPWQRIPPPSPPPDAPPAPRPPALRSRSLLAGGLSLVGAIGLAPGLHGDVRAGGSDREMAAWFALLFLVIATAYAVLRRPLAAGVVLVLALLGTSYFATVPPTYFRAPDIIWGLTPPVLLALWHLGRASTPTEPLTFAGAAAWTIGFAVKLLQVRGWR